MYNLCKLIVPRYGRGDRSTPSLPQISHKKPVREYTHTQMNRMQSLPFKISIQFITVHCRCARPCGNRRNYNNFTRNSDISQANAATQPQDVATYVANYHVPSTKQTQFQPEPNQPVDSTGQQTAHAIKWFWIITFFSVLPRLPCCSCYSCCFYWDS